MRSSRFSSALLVLFFLSTLVNNYQPTASAQSVGSKPPAIQREFRAVWIATVENIDWPSKRTLSVEQQRSEFLRILDLAQQLHLNTVILQVRPQCDALYPSTIEPWSEYLTGEMGKAPQPYYDPLKFAIEAAHARGLLVHAWFNPYRALHQSATKPPSSNHISRLRPDLAKPYGRYVWLDPGEKEVQEYSLKVVLDVVKRYDIDGVHFDDYFYPYQEKDSKGELIPFPDEASWNKYVASGGKLGRDDWRRQNVDTFVHQVVQRVKQIKPRVMFGVSPFGIWQPLPHEGIKGFNAYEGLYADARKWLREGWIDYLSPQLYWPIKQTAQSYTTLLDWWTKQNTMKRHLWPGNAAYRIGSSPAFPASEIEDQIIATRKRSMAPGNIFFSLKSLRNNLGDIKGVLTKGVYSQAALIPATPWIRALKPAPPDAKLQKDRDTGELELMWSERRSSPAFLWVIHIKRASGWESLVLPGDTRRRVFRPVQGDPISEFAVTAVDRLGNESKPKVLKIARGLPPSNAVSLGLPGSVPGKSAEA